MYMANYRCNVTNSVSTRKVAPAKPPVYCKDDQTKCVRGAKQMIAWNRMYISFPPKLQVQKILTLLAEKTGNNINTPDGASPGYNEGCGWSPGAQNDIFL